MPGTHLTRGGKAVTRGRARACLGRSGGCTRGGGEAGGGRGWKAWTSLFSSLARHAARITFSFSTSHFVFSKIRSKTFATTDLSDGVRGEARRGLSFEVIHDDVPEDTPVAIYAEGKQHALAVGITKMTTADIKSVNKGIGVDTIHYLNDGLWKTDRFEL